MKFHENLNVVTGETGAGKSILINAIGILLGNRFSREVIRTGSDSTMIEGVFDHGNTETIIRRTLSANGRSRAFINDEPVTIDQLQSATEYILDMHGQHDHQRLMNPDTHLQYLDSFGSYQDLISEIGQKFDSMQKLNAEIRQLTASIKEMSEKKELYQFQLIELNQIDLESDLDTRLSKEYETLSHAEDTRQKLQMIELMLQDSPDSISVKLAECIRVHNSMKIIPDESILTRLNGFQIDLDDLAGEVARNAHEIVLDPERLAVVADQLEHVEMLKRKYGGTMGKVIRYRDEISGQMQGSDFDRNHLTEIQKREADLTIEYQKLADQLRAARMKTALLLEEVVTKALRRMNMQDVKFQILFDKLPADQYTRYGLDRCEFYISANLGERILPLVKTASGGELSRIMLAIKLVLQEKDHAHTLVFDEVDSGISGATATKIGEILQELGRTAQVICITHLAQIASKGSSHYKIYKTQFGDRTISHIQHLKPHERVDELAALISSDKITESSREQAQKLLDG